MSNAKESEHIIRAEAALAALKRARDKVVAEAKTSVGYIIVSENGETVKKPV